MKLNKKGLTLVELIISVVLIVIVMFFMYRLLNDINAEKHDNSYAQDNTLNRGEIIKLIGEDLFSYNITNLTVTTGTNNLKINFNLKPNIKYDLQEDKTAAIEITTDTFKYTKADGTLRQWKMEGATLNTDKVDVKYVASGNNYTLLLSFLVYTDNDNNRLCDKCSNNVVDDIVISHMGEGSITGLTNQKCLGKNC